VENKDIPELNGVAWSDAGRVSRIGAKYGVNPPLRPMRVPGHGDRLMHVTTNYVQTARNPLSTGFFSYRVHDTESGETKLNVPSRPRHVPLGALDLSKLPLNECTFTKAYEGSVVGLYWDDGEWILSSAQKPRLDPEKSTLYRHAADCIEDATGGSFADFLDALDTAQGYVILVVDRRRAVDPLANDHTEELGADYSHAFALGADVPMLEHPPTYDTIDEALADACRPCSFGFVLAYADQKLLVQRAEAHIVAEGGIGPCRSWRDLFLAYHGKTISLDMAIADAECDLDFEGRDPTETLDCFYSGIVQLLRALVTTTTIKRGTWLAIRGEERIAPVVRYHLCQLREVLRSSRGKVLPYGAVASYVMGLDDGSVAKIASKVPPYAEWFDEDWITSGMADAFAFFRDKI